MSLHKRIKTLTGLMASLAIAPGKSPLPEPFQVRPGMAGLPIGLAASLSSAPAGKETQRRNHPQPLAGAVCRPPPRGETGRKPVQGLPKADCTVHKSTGAALALAFWDGVRGRRVLLHKRLPPHSRDRLSLARSLVSSVRRLNRGGQGAVVAQ